MKRKLLFIITAFILCFNITIGTALAADLANFKPVKTYTQGMFTDVKSDAWYAANVKEAYEYDLINGKGNGIFDPKGNLTIAEAIKLASCLHSIYYNGSVEISTAGAAVWYQPYVDYALKNNIISTNFGNYNRTATRLEFAAIFAHALPKEALKQINTVNDNAIPDVPVISNYGDEVYLLYRAGILTGNDSYGTFTPNSSIVRSEVAAITTRMANPTLRRAITLTGSPSGGLTAEQISAKCSSSVFYLEVYDKYGKAFASGSGFFINANGMAVTNYHVIEGAASAKIQTSDGKVYNVKGVYDYDEGRDIALLKIDGNNFPYLTVNKNSVNNGMTIYTIGSPKGLDNTISQGLVSNANRIISGYPYIQISAPISHGSSGGALINSVGEVIGITSSGIDEAQNLNFAIPIAAIDLLSKSSVTPLSGISTGGGLTASVSSVTVSAGSTTSIIFNSTNSNSDSIIFEIVGSGQNYVNCQWGDWNSSYDSIPLYIKGLAAGTAQIKVYEVDENDSLIGNVVTINVTVKGSTTGYYAGYYPAVDFGKFSGASVDDSYYDDGMQFYYYDVEDITYSVDSVITDYSSLLKEQGFVAYDSFYDDDGLPVVVFKNNSTGVYVFIGLAETKYGFYVVIALSK